MRVVIRNGSMTCAAFCRLHRIRSDWANVIKRFLYFLVLVPATVVFAFTQAIPSIDQMAFYSNSQLDGIGIGGSQVGVMEEYEVFRVNCAKVKTDDVRGVTQFVSYEQGCSLYLCKAASREESALFCAGNLRDGKAISDLREDEVAISFNLASDLGLSLGDDLSILQENNQSGYSDVVLKECRIASILGTFYASDDKVSLGSPGVIVACNLSFEPQLRAVVGNDVQTIAVYRDPPDDSEEMFYKSRGDLISASLSGVGKSDGAILAMTLMALVLLGFVSSREFKHSRSMAQKDINTLRLLGADVRCYERAIFVEHVAISLFASVVGYAFLYFAYFKGYLGYEMGVFPTLLLLIAMTMCGFVAALFGFMSCRKDLPSWRLGEQHGIDD